jgi:hypothetical protein
LEIPPSFGFECPDDGKVPQRQPTQAARHNTPPHWRLPSSNWMVSAKVFAPDGKASAPALAHPGKRSRVVMVYDSFIIHAPTARPTLRWMKAAHSRQRRTDREVDHAEAMFSPLPGLTSSDCPKNLRAIA